MLAERDLCKLGLSSLFLLVLLFSVRMILQQTKHDQPDAAARSICVIGASVCASVLDKSAGPTWEVPAGIS